MAQPSDTTKLGKSFFHAFSKTQTESTQYLFESLYKSAHSLKGSDIWVEDIPYALNVTAADNNVITYPTRIKKYTLATLTVVPGSNGQAWYLNDGGKFVRPWIAPTDIPNTTTNDPSYGYEVKLFRSDNSQIMPTSGVWMIDYYAGLILFQVGSTPTDMGYGTPKITCYNYIGQSLSSTGVIPYLYQLKDVSISSTGIVNGQVLTYNTSTGKWIATSTGTTTFNDTSTILFVTSSGIVYAYLNNASVLPQHLNSLNAPIDNTYLSHNSSTGQFFWTSSGKSYLYELKDVNLTSTGIPDGYVLTYNSSTGKWIAKETSTGASYIFNDTNTIDFITSSGNVSASIKYTSTGTILLSENTSGLKADLTSSGIEAYHLKSILSPANGQVLTYNSFAGKFLWSTLSGGTLYDDTNTIAFISSSGHVNAHLKYTSTGNIVFTEIPSGLVGNVTSTGIKWFHLNSVNIPTDQQALSWNTSTGKFMWTSSGGTVAAEDVSVDNGSFVILTGDDQQVVDDEIDGIFSKLIPPKPSNLDTKVISMTLYTAQQTGSGDSHFCTDDTTPTGTCIDFWDGVPVQGGNGAILSAEIDSVQVGSRQLTFASDVGDYGDLHITVDEDPYAGQPGRENFWHQIECNITPAIALTYVEHTYQLKATIGGNTLLRNFWVDDPGVTTISAPSKTFPGAIGRYISGVPSLATGDTTRVGFTVSNAARKHYGSVRVASISSAETTDITNITAPSVPNEGDPIVITNQNLTVEAAKYIENCTPAIYGYNSKNIAGTVNNFATNARIDTVSSEATRRTAGSGQYPAAGYDAAFDSTQSLKTVYTEELQLLNGIYRLPTGNYTSNVPTAGPDYSSGMGALDRWLIYKHGTLLSSATGFTITVGSPGGTWTGAGQITTGLKLYAKVEGVTGWIDCNAAYPGIGSPVNNGDPAEVVGSSTYTVKRVTFGSTPRSGTLYVRLGLPVGSDKTFALISVGSIS